MIRSVCSVNIIMSYTFTISERDSILSTRIYPPIILNSDEEYVLGLIDFVSSNSMANVDKSNNQFHVGNYAIEIPDGSYEIDDIEKLLKSRINEKETTAVASDKILLSISANLNTLKCELKCNEVIDFTKANSIGSLLGFDKRKLPKYKKHVSDFPINIQKVNAICVDCNLVTNSYNNGIPVHILHMFYPTVPPGYKIVEVPKNVIYLPINTHHIDEINIKIIDQHGNLVNFNKELVTVRVHLKKLK